MIFEQEGTLDCDNSKNKGNEQRICIEDPTSLEKEPKWESHGQHDHKERLRADLGRPDISLNILDNYLYLKRQTFFLELSNEKSGC